MPATSQWWDYIPFSDIIDMNTLKSSMNLFLKEFGRAEYFGEIKYGLRHGIGIMKYENGTIYEGHWVNDYKEGLGAEKTQNNDKYEGYYLKGKPHGQGTFFWKNGDTYQGEWNNGLRHGYGILKNSKGETFEGKWQNDKPEGKESQILQHDEVYTGNFGDGFECEWSRICYNNGDIYFGPHQNQIPNGYGRLIEIDGGIYTGNFVGGKKNGFGIWQKICRNSIQKYTGMFYNDVKHGYGVYYWESGSQYKGQFFNDEREGLGEMTWSDGSKFIGEWRKGKQNGYGKLYYNNGEVKLVYIRNNKIVEPPQDLQIPEELNNPHFRIGSLAPSEHFLSNGNHRLHQYELNDKLFDNPLSMSTPIRFSKNPEPRKMSKLSICHKSLDANHSPQFLIRKINPVESKTPLFMLVENSPSPIKSIYTKRFRIRNRSAIKNRKIFHLNKSLSPDKIYYIS